MKKIHEVKNIQFSGNKMMLEIDGENQIFDLNDVSSSLLEASDLERMAFEISPSGYGVHWPLMDEDISIDGLLGVAHEPKQKPMMAKLG